MYVQFQSDKASFRDAECCNKYPMYVCMYVLYGIMFILECILLKLK